jgi:putative membrane-bound dehydrogenase-like protein
MRRLAVLALALAAASAGLRAQEGQGKVPYLTPEQAVAKMTYPAGIEVSIYAAEPKIGQPIAFTFDPRGRLWVVENFNYRTRGNHTTDMATVVSILEDADGDGRHDTKKIFTDRLTFTSGIAVGHGGVWVGSPPHFSFIPDADGDDRPDGPPQPLLDGWGIHDRHETLNSFLWGPDGWLYGCHGVFTNSNVGKIGAPDAERQKINGGIWRYHPVRHVFEVFAHGLSNPWGMDFDDRGQMFATACVIPHLFHVAQGGYYHRQSGQHFNRFVYDDIKTIRDHVHKSAHGGARFYLADAFPAPYRQRLFMCNIHQHQVLTDVIEKKGSGFVGRHGDDFLSANDVQWVGFSVEIGPEGAVYILDWHDQDICGKVVVHGDTGRIYRLLPRDAKKVARPDLASLPDADLVALQTHGNDWYVRQARTILHHRAATGKLDPATPAKLKALFEAQTDGGRRLRALWAWRLAGGLDPATLLDHADEYVRAWAVQYLGEDRKPTAEAAARFASLAKSDASPVVRLYLASALQRMAPELRWPVLEGLVARAEDVEDPNLPLMIWYGLEPLVPLDKDKALKLMLASKIPVLRQFVVRRIAGETGGSPGRNPAEWSKTLRKVAPLFSVAAAADDEGGVQFQASFRNRPAVQTHPVSREKPCVLRGELDVPAGRNARLRVKVSHHPHGDWQLVVRADGKVLLDRVIGASSVTNEWADLEIELKSVEGKRVKLELENRANGWNNEFGYWNEVALVVD